MAKKARSANQEDGTKAARTRERILDAAAHVLSRKGYSGTRLGDIAEQAQIQAPAIYYYFGSREELIEEVMWAGVHRLHQHVSGALEQLPADTPPMEQILKAVEAHLHIELELSDFATAAIRNAGQLPEELRTRQLAAEAEYSKLWRGLLTDLNAAGQLRSDLDPIIAHLLVVGALNWAAEWWNPRRGSFDAVVRSAQSLVRYGLSSRAQLAEPDEEPARPRRRQATRRTP
ncbi:regulatory protein TetR [Streptomyces albus]|uniref:Regulatory protein TetR n=1 Tax=Streptomyces albus (strain ATCC 21838 / DSM 41398 / FERM P-419 / JCM 4703 / NBRC 107858) TaxID=1081613 RepID=A0A0B5ENM6_STRA4|nr:regulatory protein TetR [Streptomyces albus]AOU74736.1 regulatory protein TetR [Streptomyces albus]AYN30547.1 regulatory protein TetR [Streptomyces albus]